MVRRRYYYRRTSRPKQKWAINTVNSVVTANQTTNISTNSSASFGRSVCTNASRITATATNETSAAQVLKTGRWKFKGIITNVTTNMFYIIYLIYVPEGYMPLTSDQTGLEGGDIFYRHPEWVIAWTRKDYVSIEQNNEISITSRLKRNLNTNDSVQLRVLVQNIGSQALSVTADVPIIRGTVSYCCRAN